jgi:hypothetical protein
VSDVVKAVEAWENVESDRVLGVAKKWEGVNELDTAVFGLAVLRYPSSAMFGWRYAAVRSGFCSLGAICKNCPD